MANEGMSAAAKADQPGPDPKVVPIQAQAGAPKAATFSPLQPQPATAQPSNLDFLLDVPLKVSVQLGGARMVIRDLLQLGQGSIIELEKMAGEPMDVLIGDKLVARGEVVVVNERFGIRLTDIVSPTERLQQLQKG
jgi:flagellar motor switch protein FliN/FliY